MEIHIYSGDDPMLSLADIREGIFTAATAHGIDGESSNAQDCPIYDVKIISDLAAPMRIGLCGLRVALAACVALEAEHIGHVLIRGLRPRRALQLDLLEHDLERFSGGGEM